MTACEMLGLRWKVQCGGMRNHVETLFGSLKLCLRATRRRLGARHTQTNLTIHSYAAVCNDDFV